jgi:hypothetical protein
MRICLSQPWTAPSTSKSEFSKCKTAPTRKIQIRDGFDKTLKLHFLKRGGPMGCLYETNLDQRFRFPLVHIHQYLASRIMGQSTNVPLAHFHFDRGSQIHGAVYLKPTFLVGISHRFVDFRHTNSKSIFQILHSVIAPGIISFLKLSVR